MAIWRLFKVPLKQHNIPGENNTQESEKISSAKQFILITINNNIFTKKTHKLNLIKTKLENYFLNNRKKLELKCFLKKTNFS